MILIAMLQLIVVLGVQSSPMVISLTLKILQIKLKYKIRSRHEKFLFLSCIPKSKEHCKLQVCACVCCLLCGDKTSIWWVIHLYVRTCYNRTYARNFVIRLSTWDWRCAFEFGEIKLNSGCDGDAGVAETCEKRLVKWSKSVIIFICQVGRNE